ncbi:MAG: BrnT family toxin [Thermodesulfobacteriota bacterium]
MELEWDRKKSVSNNRKRAVSFVEAATVFGDPLAITFRDPDLSWDEDRFITFGTSQLGRLLVVSHVDRFNATRIISSRRMTRQDEEHV